MDTSASDPIDRRVRAAVREALEVGVGLGVLGFQRAQVRRRELERSTGLTIPDSPAALVRMLSDRCGHP